MSLDAAICLRDVVFRYGRSFRRRPSLPMLDTISFDVFRGETLGVIGRNGAGKSTLLKLLAGIIAPDSGSLEFRGPRASLLSLQVGFLPHLSGRQNAILSGMLLGWTRREVVALLPDIVSFAELEDHIDDPTRTYSAGMRARLGFSVAFFTDPEVLLIDEVLGVGDIDFRKKSTEAMRQRINSNKTVVLVSHNLGTIESLCNRVVWIEGGRLLDVGEPNRILKEYTAYARLLEPKTANVSRAM